MKRHLFGGALPFRGLLSGFLLTGTLVAADPPGEVAERPTLPLRVHVFEDYETEIEKRWWLRGIPVTDKALLPPSLSESVANTRACRAAETKDFDDKQGDPSKTWKAVIFNPVPGPPMGPKTRLHFRYRLTGTDSLRVQIYSLTKGYHRRHFLTKLPQGKWERADIDMTQLRRPDGSGGPLAADERIDDIQFYITPDADLLIDDLVLYEASPEDEKENHPFPRRILFTGWFDTGEQGKEWPGDFAIVPHEKPLTWDCAKSVSHTANRKAWIRVQLRGLRPLGAVNRLQFRGKLTAAGPLTIRLRNSHNHRQWTASPVHLRPGGWVRAAADFKVEEGEMLADQLEFFTGEDTEFFVDDLLLFEP